MSVMDALAEMQVAYFTEVALRQTYPGLIFLFSVNTEADLDWAVAGATSWP